MATTRYVRETSSGWEVMREGDRRSAVRADTQSKAIERAREIVRRQGGGEVRIVNRVGKVVEATKVARPASRNR